MTPAWLHGSALALMLSLPSVAAFAEDAPGEAPQPAVPATGEHRALIAAVDQAIEAQMQTNFLPGAAVVLVQNGRTFYKRGYGIASVRSGVRVDPDRTIFRIGSISKALTLLTLARLVDDGRLSRTDDVAEFFEHIENAPDVDQPVTIDHLLTHTSGFDQPGYGRQIGLFDRPLAQRQAARPSLATFLSQGHLRRVNAPGEYFRYDTYGTSLAGVIIERVTGKPFAEAMQREMFAPLGMARSAVEVRPQHLKDLASGHGYVDGEYVTTPYEVYLTVPASSVDATVADMGRLLEALTGGGANAHGRLFSETMARAALAPQYRPRADFAGMTHGLWESLSEGRGAEAVAVRTIGHGGDMWGFNGAMTIIPEFDLGIYVVTNRNGEGGGPGVRIGRPVMTAVLSVLAPGRAAHAVSVPERDPHADLSEYAGDYYWGVYCRSCTDTEFELGAWPRPQPRRVSASNGALRVGDGEFLPHPDEAGLFIKADGYEQIYFRRDDAGRITSFSWREDPTVYERAGE